MDFTQFNRALQAAVIYARFAFNPPAMTKEREREMRRARRITD